MRHLSYGFAGLVLAITVAGILIWNRILTRLEEPLPARKSEWVLRFEQPLEPRALLSALRRAGWGERSVLLSLFVEHGLKPMELPAGEYAFSASDSFVDHLDRVRRHEVVLHTVSFSPGLDARKTARVWARAGLLDDPEAFLQAVRDPQLSRALDLGAEGLEGYLFPDVYAVPRGMSPEALVRRMVSRFRQAIRPLFGPDPELDRLREAVWMAAQIQQSPVPSREWALLSAVLHARRESGWVLGSPSVPEDREAPLSLYGPVRRRGPFEPGPIEVNPGLEALRAVARPMDSEARHLVLQPDGSRIYCADRLCHREAVRGRRERFRRLAVPTPPVMAPADSPTQAEDPSPADRAAPESVP
jgi:UPF0755 protein